ncbi:MAG: hypothetical protein DRP65_10955 [Planctomycetota bacterium]|nr:MAG: hypothetical protein DRP65_10955 [Planctomycetota bacterium]
MVSLREGCFTLDPRLRGDDKRNRCAMEFYSGFRIKSGMTYVVKSAKLRNRGPFGFAQDKQAGGLRF